MTPFDQLVLSGFDRAFLTTMIPFDQFVLSGFDLAFLTTLALTVLFILPVNAIYALVALVLVRYSYKRWLRSRPLLHSHCMNCCPTYAKREKEEPKEEPKKEQVPPPPPHKVLILPIIRNYEDEILLEIREVDGVETVNTIGANLTPMILDLMMQSKRGYAAYLARRYLPDVNLQFMTRITLEYTDDAQVIFYIADAIDYAVQMSEDVLQRIGIKRVVWTQPFYSESNKGWFIQDGEAVIPMHGKTMDYIEDAGPMLRWATTHEPKKADPLVM